MSVSGNKERRLPVRRVLLLGLLFLFALHVPMGGAWAAPVDQIDEPTIMDDLCDGSVDPGTGFVSRIVPCLSDRIIGLGFDFTEQIYPVIESAIFALAMLATLIFGIKLFYGGIEKVPRATFEFILKLSCVLYFSSHLGTYDPYDFDVLSTVLDLLDGLLLAITEASTLSGALQCPVLGVTLWARIDCMLNMVIGITSPRLLADGMSAFFFYSVFSGTASLLIGLLGLWMTFNLVLGIFKAIETYIVTLIALIMTVLMGMIFIPLIFFSALDYFKKWIQMIGGLLVKPVIVFAYLNVVLSGFDLVLYSGSYSVFHAFAGDKVTVGGDPFKITDYMADNKLLRTATPGPVLDQNSSLWNTGAMSQVQGLWRQTVQNGDKGATQFDTNQIAQLPLGIPVQAINWDEAAKVYTPAIDKAKLKGQTAGKYLETQVFGAMLVAGLVSYVLILLLNNIEYLANQLAGVAKEVGSNLGGAGVGGVLQKSGLGSLEGLTAKGATQKALGGMKNIGEGKTLAGGLGFLRGRGSGLAVGTGVAAASSAAAASTSGGGASGNASGPTVARPGIKAPATGSGAPAAATRTSAAPATTARPGITNAAYTPASASTTARTGVSSAPASTAARAEASAPAQSAADAARHEEIKQAYIKSENARIEKFRADKAAYDARPHGDPSQLRPALKTPEPVPINQEKIAADAERFATEKMAQDKIYEAKRAAEYKAQRAAAEAAHPGSTGGIPQPIKTGSAAPDGYTGIREPMRRPDAPSAGVTNASYEPPAADGYTGIREPIRRADAAPAKPVNDGYTGIREPQPRTNTAPAQRTPAEAQEHQEYKDAYIKRETARILEHNEGVAMMNQQLEQSGQPTPFGAPRHIDMPSAAEMDAKADKWATEAAAIDHEAKAARAAEYQAWRAQQDAQIAELQPAADDLNRQIGKDMTSIGTDRELKITVDDPIEREAMAAKLNAESGGKIVYNLTRDGKISANIDDFAQYSDQGTLSILKGES